MISLLECDSCRCRRPRQLYCPPFSPPLPHYPLGRVHFPRKPPPVAQRQALYHSSGGVGDGNLTQTTSYPNDGSANRVSQFAVDWRDRQVASKAGNQTSEDSTTHRPILFTTYDNLDEAIVQQQYDGDTLTVSTTAPAASLLRAQTNTDYDNQGRVYRTYVYSVDPSSGALSSTALVTNTFYDHRNNVIEVIPPNGPATENVYDGAGRLVHTYTVVPHNDRSSEIGTYNSGTGTFYLDSNHDYTYDTGDATDPWASSSAAIPVIGDWNGSGTTKIGTFNPLYNTWYLDTNGDASFDTGDNTYTSFHPGGSGEIPVVGDWTGDGKTKIGMYDPATGTWYLDANGNGTWDGTSGGDVSFTYNPTSSSSATPVVGDWTGDGVSKVGIFLSGTWYLDKNNNHTWDGSSGGDGYSSGQFGTASGALPIVGDWSGDGVSKIGSYYVGTWYVDVNNDYAYDTGDTTYSWGGAPGASPQTGTYVPSYDGSWSYAGTVSNAIVLSQTDNTYDNNGNVILVGQHERFDNDSTSSYGPLGTATSGLGARTSYMASYFDGADRLTCTVDVGTYGGSAYTRPSSAPSRSDTVLVTSQVYNNAGWVSDVTDPRGIVQHTDYDALGRTVRDVASYDTSTTSTSTNVTTAYTYDGDSNVLTITTSQDATANYDLATGTTPPTNSTQVTQYVYGVSTSTGSYINSNDIVSAMEYPDVTTGQPSSTSKETYTVNALGQRLTYTDRNGTTHTYTYDVLGWLTKDAITTLGSGVDNTVLRIEYAYDTQGNQYLITSYNAASGGSIVNQVKREFNGLGQLTREWQENGGAVTGSSPNVQYGYSLMAGGANNSRLTSITYPNGYVVYYNYNSGTGYGANIDTNISRLSSISDSNGTLESYTYLGTSIVVARNHPQDGVNLTYIGTGTGDAGDQYMGLDRFGRVVTQLWVTSGGTVKDEYAYAYDRDSNRAAKTNSLNSALNETYGYDNLNQLTSFNRGSGTFTVSWSDDSQGNFSSVTTNGTPVSRTDNKQNELTGVGSSTLAYDGTGNMTTDQNGNTLKYDAWNRLISYSSGGSTLISYTYDGLGRRITENRSGSVTHLYYSENWQVLEEQISNATTMQYVWSPVYVDALVLRNQYSGGSISQRLYVMQDANWNVTGLVNTSGTVLERYAYEAFGAVMVFDASWTVRTGGTFYAEVYGFQGLRGESLDGSYDARGRVYWVTLGRFGQADKERFTAGTDFYVLDGNAPTTNLDPSGTTWVHVGSAIGPDSAWSELSTEVDTRWPFGVWRRIPSLDVPSVEYYQTRGARDVWNILSTNGEWGDPADAFTGTFVWNNDITVLGDTLTPKYGSTSTSIRVVQKYAGLNCNTVSTGATTGAGVTQIWLKDFAPGRYKVTIAYDISVNAGPKAGSNAQLIFYDNGTKDQQLFLKSGGKISAESKSGLRTVTVTVADYPPNYALVAQLDPNIVSHGPLGETAGYFGRIGVVDIERVGKRK